jgi:hypothetical protein
MIRDHSRRFADEKGGTIMRPQKWFWLVLQVGLVMAFVAALSPSAFAQSHP